MILVTLKVFQRKTKLFAKKIFEIITGCSDLDGVIPPTRNMVCLLSN